MLNGDFMNVDKIKSKLEQNNRVSFKLYSLDYIIEIKNEKIELYSPTYPNDIRKYNNIDELLNSFTVYNETLIEVDSKIEKII